jgi:hypothetical protein
MVKPKWILQLCHYRINVSVMGSPEYQTLAHFWLHRNNDDPTNKDHWRLGAFDF